MYLSFFGLGFLALGLLFLLLPLIALIDILRSSFRNDSDKLIWVLVVLFFNVIGAILYFIMGGNQKIRPRV